MSKRVYLKEYDINLTANGIQVLLVEGEYFRIQSSSGAISINVDGLGELPGLLAGQGIGNTPFKRLVLRDVSGLSNVGKLLVSNEEFIDNRTFGVNSLDAATINSLKLPTPRPEAHNGFFNDGTATVANTAVTLILPAANVNGVILLDASLSWYDSIAHRQAFISKASTPATTYDGAVMLDCGQTALGGTVASGFFRLQKEHFVPAGLGLYFIDSSASVVAVFNYRSARFKVL